MYHIHHPISSISSRASPILTVEMELKVIHKDRLPLKIYRTKYSKNKIFIFHFFVLATDSFQISLCL